MNHRLVVAAALALLLAPAVAGAQGFAPVLPPYEIATIVRSAGFNPLERPFRRGPVYVVPATGRGGAEVRVVVDARYGEIVAVRPLAFAGRMAPGYGYGYGPYERMSGPAVDPRGAYSAAPGDDVDDEPSPYGARPRGALPPPRVSAMPPNEPYGGPQTARPLREPRVITAIPESEVNGPLPPPPERFQHRPLPPGVAKPAPPKRAAAVQTTPPLPKPRPEMKPSAAEVQASPAPSATSSAQPEVSPAPPAVADDPVPH